jgi:hypothetical protein
VTRPNSANAVGLAEDPPSVRERLIHNQPPTIPRTTTARITQSTGLGEKLTSEYTRGLLPRVPALSIRSTPVGARPRAGPPLSVPTELVEEVVDELGLATSRQRFERTMETLRPSPCLETQGSARGVDRPGRDECLPALGDVLTI